jgi:8-oxo-dGTP diphosphatase
MKHLDVVAGIICCGEEILCMQRPESKYEYISFKYEFPGGKIEAGETKVDALKRELIEEMEMKVQLEEQDNYLTVNHAYPDFEITMHSYICRVNNKDFIMKEHKDFKWLKREELAQLDWAMADVPIMEKLMKI